MRRRGDVWAEVHASCSLCRSSCAHSRRLAFRPVTCRETAELPMRSSSAPCGAAYRLDNRMDMALRGATRCGYWLEVNAYLWGQSLQMRSRGDIRAQGHALSLCRTFCVYARRPALRSVTWRQKSGGDSHLPPDCHPSCASPVDLTPNLENHHAQCPSNSGSVGCSDLRSRRSLNISAVAAVSS